MGATFNVTGNVYIEKQIEISGGAVQFNDSHNDEHKAIKKEDIIIPAEFQSEQALAIYEKLKKANVLDENLQPKCSRPRAALLAQELSERLGIKHSWTYYEKMWHRENMRNDLQKALERPITGNYIAYIKEILDDKKE